MQAAADSLLIFAHVAFVELALFAAVGFIIGGIDELLIDLIWLVRTGWRRVTVYRRYSRTYAAELPAPPPQFRLAVFIPAWREANVIADMLTRARAAYSDTNVTIFVGCYANDPATIAAASPFASERIRIIIGDRPGPTTKADNLNLLWRALNEQVVDVRFDAVCLHDAEDVISPFETRVVAHLLPRFGILQLPVVPLVDRQGRWISGHYCDEFAESHGKTLIVREALGAALPLAGVGCVLRLDILRRLADASENAPFDPVSLTEDYETGLRLGATGCPSAFVRMLDRRGGALVATRALFPADFEQAVRQKSRWIIGIGISGWDRIGWGRGFVENWMRLRDRLGLLSALVLTAGYLAFIFGLIFYALDLLGGRAFEMPASLTVVFSITFGLMIWRLLVRSFLVAKIYGLAEGTRAIPRAILANLIAIVAAQRAVFRYIAMLRKGAVEWDKTAHRFPEGIA